MYGSAEGRCFWSWGRYLDGSFRVWTVGATKWADESGARWRQLGTVSGLVGVAVEDRDASTVKDVGTLSSGHWGNEHGEDK